MNENKPAFDKDLEDIMKNDNDLAKIPEPNAGDIVHTAVRTIVSVIPGGSELVNAIITPPIEKRHDEWIQSVAIALTKHLQEHQDITAKDLSGNEMFITSLLHASQIAIRNHPKEKLEALRNAVLNATLPNAPDEELQMMYINFIDILVPWHLKILKFFENPKEWARKNRITYPEGKIRDRNDLVEYTFPELRGKIGFYHQIVSYLETLGLTTQITSFFWQHLKSTEQMLAPAISPMGKQFLEFITLPIGNDNV